MVDFEDESPNGKAINGLSILIIFSLISVLLVFVSVFVLAGINNYGISELYNFTENYISTGQIPAGFSTVSDQTAGSLPQIIGYLDYVWAGAFILMIVGSFMFSYFRKRDNYFSILTMATIGLIVFTFIGGYLIQVTDWFKTEYLFAVLPSVQGQMSIFSWYLENVAVINLIVFSVNIVLNFVDLDLSRFAQRKNKDNGGGFDEI